MAERHGYEAEFVPVGPDDPEVGPPTQMAVFTIRTENDTSGESHTSGKSEKDEKGAKAA